MKSRNKYFRTLLFAGVLFAASSCDDFLDRQPLSDFTDNNFWSSEANLKTYAWGFYDEFLGYGNGVGTTAEFYFLWTGSTSNVVNITDDLANANFLRYTVNATVSNTYWSDRSTIIRRANKMLEKLPEVPGLSQSARNHYEGVARFFRAYSYFRLVQRFGNVPYYDYTVGSVANDEVIYVPYTERGKVIDNVLADLTEAVAKLNANSKDNTVNKDVALALKSRVALYEGTYRKYHKLGDGSTYLTAAKEVANQLMSSGTYSIGTTPASFKANYNSEDLASNKEMILYKSYKTGLLAHSVQAFTNTSSIGNGMTKWAIESYTTLNGLPIEQSGNSQYLGDKSLENVLANRDPRLLATIDSEGISYAGITNSISRSRTSSSGYVVNLYYNSASQNITTTGQNTIDAPVFTYPEVLLNYAEACAELGSITQSDLDKSVNLLRARVGLPKLTYLSDDNVQVDGVTINDPKRTTALENVSGIVPSIIWEVRRERRAELMTWSIIRAYDLMRWHKGEYTDTNKNPDVALGAYVGTVPAGEKIVLNDKGYLIMYNSNTLSREFVDPKNYLNPIPTNEIQLYKTHGVDVLNNPGW